LARLHKPGTVLHERYRIAKRIGHGGMGTVYEADDLRLKGRKCAVKEIMSDLLSNADMAALDREQFYREASILARLDHPNLPKVSDYFSQDEYDYLVMDFVAGQNLQQVVAEATAEGRFLPEKQVLAWAGQLADAIGYLHNQSLPVIHRDIKPGNIKLTPSGTIKLVDFGLVRLLAPDDDRTITIVQGRGTVMYAPLEQYGSDTGQTDERSDIYSFGATLYHLLTGQPPLDARQRFLRPGALVAPRAVNSALSPQTERAILWAMEMHPDARPPDIAAFVRSLTGSAPGGPANAASAPPTSRASLSTQMMRSAGWLYAWQKNWGLVLLVMALFIIAALLSVRAGG